MLIRPGANAKTNTWHVKQRVRAETEVRFVSYKRKRKSSTGIRASHRCNAVGLSQ